MSKIINQCIEKIFTPTIYSSLVILIIVILTIALKFNCLNFNTWKGLFIATIIIFLFFFIRDIRKK
jgi:hypothetical protein